MKKICLLLAFLLGRHANAQYFQHLYGNLGTYETNKQMVPATQSGNGYVLVGQHFDGQRQHMHVVCTDNNGNPLLGGNHRYAVSDANGNYNAYATSVAEITANNPAFAVAGTVVLNSSYTDQDVVLMITDGSGNATSLNRYSFNNYTLLNPHVIASNNVLQDSTVYITGNGRSKSPGVTQDDIYIISINYVTGNVNWGYVYDLRDRNNPTISWDDKGISLIESPFANELLVVGESNNMGLLLKVSTLNGSPNSVTTYTLSSLQRLSCIRRSNNPLVPGGGFVVGGSVLVGGGLTPQHMDMWTMLIDPAGNIIWSTNHNTGNGTPMYNFCFDIVERVNTLGNYEYYPAGTWKDPVPAIWPVAFMQVLKLDGTGMMVPNGEFLYGTNVFQEYTFGYSIALSQTGGITVSGDHHFITGGTGDADQLLVNAYFSGHSSCNYSIENPSSVINSPLVSNAPLSRDSSFSVNSLSFSDASLSDVTVCYNVTLAPPASNALEAPVKKSPEMLAFRLKPGMEYNVLQSGIIEIDIENSQSQQPEVQVVDQLGRSIKCQLEFIPLSGKEAIGRIHCQGLQKGMYFISISDGHGKHSRALFIP